MSLVARAARNHRQKPVDDAADDRRTPAEFFARIHAEHHFTVDAAASETNALLPRFWTRTTDALSQSWTGERVWCNPPYSRLEPWIVKAWAEMEAGCHRIVMLVPANRCEQVWWQRHVEPWRDGRAPRPWLQHISLRVQFLPGRMRFAWPAGRVVPLKGDRPPFGLVLLTFSSLLAPPPETR